ncbi:MAG: hypothetical protein IH612_10340 [Desulfofustis sp.]|nr:hypothetical protein [Desulfofustis sp.]
MAEKKHMFDDPKNIRRVLYVLYCCCAVLFILDFVIHRHLIHPWERLVGFYAVYGFVGCVVLVLIAKWMRTFLMRDEAYYDREELSVTEAEGGGDHVEH